jgi:hypothetical protein
MLEPRSGLVVFSQANTAASFDSSKVIDEYVIDGVGKPWTLSSHALLNKVFPSPDSCFSCRKKQEDEGDDDHHV